MAYPKVGSFGSSHYKIEDCPSGHAERHLVRDEGVAGSNPATPTSPTTKALIGSDSLLDYICGHAPATEGRRYGAPDLKDMARAIERFPRYEIASDDRPEADLKDKRA